MDNYPISSNSLEKFYYVNGNHFGQQYKDYLSGYKKWDQKEHASKWMLFPENIGSHLSLDETSLSNGELYTVLTNKAAKGKKGAIVAMIEGTQSDNIIKVLKQIPEETRNKVAEVTLDMAGSMHRIVKKSFPKASKVIDRFHVQKLAYDALQEMRIKHRWDAINEETKLKGVAYTKLAKWFNDITDSGFKSFNTISATVYAHYPEILNFFDNRSTNASAESFNAKIKAFRAVQRGVTDTSFFMFRLANIYA